MTSLMVQEGRLACLPPIEDPGDLTVDDMTFYTAQWQHWVDDMRPSIQQMQDRLAESLLGAAAIDKMLRNHDVSSYVATNLNKGDFSDHFVSCGYRVHKRNENTTLKYEGPLNSLPDVPLIRDGVPCEVEVKDMDCVLFNHLYIYFKAKQQQAIRKGQITRLRNNKRKHSEREDESAKWTREFAAVTETVAVAEEANVHRLIPGVNCPFLEEDEDGMDVVEWEATCGDDEGDF